jgi:peptidoglycan/LPS O-acetylase OafA/YrhL
MFHLESMQVTLPAKRFLPVMSPGAFRLLLAAIVFISHTLPLLLGSTAVYLFFMLSGFWIWTMWHREYAELERPIARFLLSRAWRLYPVYFASLACLAVCCWPLHLVTLPWPSHLDWPAVRFYVAQIAVLGHAQLDGDARLISTAWSLDVEIQFYLIAPLLILLLGPKLRQPLWQIVVHAIAGLGLLMFLMFYGAVPATGTLPQYLCFFLIGMWAAQLDWHPSARQSDLAVGLAALIVGGCLLSPGVRGLFLFGRHYDALSVFNAQANVLLAFVLAPYAIATVRRPSRGLDRHMGAISYEVYLVHGAALAVYQPRFESLARATQLPYIAMMALIVAVISVAIYLLIDQPLERMRHRHVQGWRNAGSRTGH